MKVIFLDIDGVLNHGLVNEDPEKPFVAKNLEPFNRFIEAAGAKIVVSSSWRTLIGEDQDYATKEGFFQFLRDEGLKGEMIDVTPVLRGVDRSEEIQTWLRGAEGLGIEDYLIFDDVVDSGMPKEHTLELDFEVGFTKTHAERALHRLAHGTWPEDL